MTTCPGTSSSDTSTETKVCTRCKEEQPRDAFSPRARAKDGLHHWCRACVNASTREWYYRNHEKRRAQLDAYKAAHPEKRREERKRKWQRHRERLLAENRAWCQANPQKRRATDRARYWRDPEKRDIERRYRAVEEGQTSPICRRVGFALVRDQDGNYRAARLDRPILPGERAVAHYQLFHASVKEGIAGVERWIVLAPPLAHDKSLLRKLVTRERSKAA